MGLDKRKAAYVPFAQTVPLKYTIDRKACLYFQAIDKGKKGKCKACEKFCEQGAVNFEQQETHIDLNVGAVILAPGFQAFDPSKFEAYQYTNFKNVLTSMDFERILSATGPTGGHLQRPSDKEEPKKIAWFQCVGSRDVNRCDHAYCSSVCCMYAVKEAMIAVEHAHDPLDAAIFFMDMRTYGKDFEKYYDRAKGMGMRFVRCRVHSVEENEDKSLKIRYVDEKGNLHVPFWRATGIASDTRIRPKDSLTLKFEFAVDDPDDEPSAEATLIYRPVVRPLAEKKSWNVSDILITSKVW